MLMSEDFIFMQSLLNPDQPRDDAGSVQPCEVVHVCVCVCLGQAAAGAAVQEQGYC